MKSILWTVGTLLIFLECYCLLPERNPQLEVPLHFYLKGAIHVHSTHSDGGGSVSEIADAARRAGLDFVILTDHNNSIARNAGQEKRYAGVDLFVESEISAPAGHCLAFYSHSDAKSMSDSQISSLAYQHYLGQNTKKDFFVAIAHPSNLKNPWNRFDFLPDGMEVVNFDSIWQRDVYEGVLGFVGTVLLYPFNNFLSALRFFEIYRKDFNVWDQMNLVKPGRFGILAHDTHSKVKLNPNLEFRWPSYLKTFKLASNVIFLKEPPAADFEARKYQLYSSLKSARLAFIFQGIFPFEGNDWYARCGENTYRSGETIEKLSDCEFVIRTPKTFPFRRQIQLWKDGTLTHELPTHENELRLPFKEPGIYRVEVWAKTRTIFSVFLGRDVPYVFYNPIYVK